MLLNIADFSTHVQMFIQKNDLECALITWNIIWKCQFQKLFTPLKSQYVVLSHGK